MTAAAVRCRPRRWSGLRAASEAGGLRRAPAGSGTADGEGRRSAAVDVASGRPDSRPRSHPPQPQPARRHRGLRRPAAGNLHHSVNGGVLQLRFDIDSTAIRPRHDHSTTYVTATGLSVVGCYNV